MLDILEDNVINYMDSALNVIDAETTVSDAAKEMASKKLDSLLVLNGSDITGIVTTADILEKVVAGGLNSGTTRLNEIKSYPIRDIHKDSSVIDAIKIMNEYDIRRLLVRDDEKPIGMITRKQIVGNMGNNAIALPELEVPNQIKCPYCESFFPDKETLSKHIDEIHIGKGLLEGNLKRA